MSDAAKKNNPAIRTFAQDLNAERLKRGQNPEVETETKAGTAPEVEKVIPVKKPEIKLPEPEVVVAPKVEDVKTPTVPTNIELPSKPTPPPAAPIKIPAFHELQKKVDLISHDDVDYAQTKKVTPSKETKPIRTNIGFDATVITDTKSKRFKLIPALVASFKKWLISLKPAKKVLPPPQYTVPEASHRKGVIQKATSKTGAAFTADKETLKEQIRLRQQKEILPVEAEVPTPPIPEVEPETTWSPYTEVGYNLLESPKADVTENVVIEYKKITKPEPIIETSEPIAEIAEEELSEPVTLAEALPQPENIAESDWEAEDSLLENRWSGVNQILEVEVDTKAEAEQPKITLEKPVLETTLPQTESAPINLKTDLLKFRTNTLTLTILILIIGVLVVFFAARIIFTQINTDNSEQSIKLAPAILEGSTVNPILLASSDVDSVAKLINVAVSSAASGIIELPITAQTGEEITPAYTFNLLGFEAKPTLKQSITTARFVSNNQSKPTLIISFIDADTVKGGLLSWEGSIFNDFNQLYQKPVPQNSEFIDDSINGFDVRVLKNDSDIILIYGFINDSTLIISPDNSSFETFSNLTK